MLCPIDINHWHVSPAICWQAVLARSVSALLRHWDAARLRCTTRCRRFVLPRRNRRHRLRRLISYAARRWTQPLLETH